MQSNRILVAALVALLAGQASLGLAQAQTATGSDVYVVSVDYGRSRVADVPAPINITIRNGGAQTFNPPTGWQIFVGLNGKTEDACITAGQAAGLPETFQDCYIRMGPGSQNPSIAAGATRVFQLAWNADPSQVNTSAFIWVEILNLAASPGATDCAGPDSYCPNNGFNQSGVRIDRLGVRATPDRDLREVAGSNVNDAWRFGEIPASALCPSGSGPDPQPVRRGCWAAPGQTFVTEFFVNNTGTIEDTYVPELEPASVRDAFLARGYQFSFAPNTARVAANSSSIVRMSVYVPLNETAHEGMNINTTEIRAQWRSATLSTLVTSTPAPTNAGCTSQDPCQNPTLPTFIVGQRYQFNLTTNFTHDETSIGEQTEFRINLTNLGNAADRFNVSFVKDSRTITDDWAPSVEAHPALSEFGDPLPAGENHSVRLFVKPPPQTLNGTYWFDVAVKSRGDESRATCKHWEGVGLNQVRVSGQGPVCTVRFFVHVRQAWGINGTEDIARREVPGKTVSYNLVVRNDGNGYDNLTLNLAASEQGWNPRLSRGTLALAPYSSTSFTLTVTAPANLPENRQASFYVNATANGPPDVPGTLRSNVSLASHFTVARGPNIRLDAPTTRGFVDPGKHLNFTITATNIGNIPDNFTVPLPARPADWEVEVDPPHHEVQPGESFPITVSLRAPDGALTGENVTAAFRVASTVDPSLDASLTLEGNISGPDLYVESVVTNTTTPYTRDPLEVTVLFGNGGNKPVTQNTTLRVYFVRQGVEQLIAQKRYDPLDPTQALGAQRRVSETFVWDTSNAEGTGEILVRIDADGEVLEMDESIGSNEARLDVTFRKPGLRLDTAAGQRGAPGEIVRYDAPNSFSVVYLGDDPAGEPVRILIESEHGWLTSAGEIFDTLRPNEPRLIQPVLQIPTLPGTARDTLTITVEPTRRPSELQRASVTTSVDDLEKPIVKSITASPPTGRVGEPLTLFADVQDATGVTVVTAYITAPNNQTSAHPMAPTGDGRWALNSTFVVPGDYHVTAEAADAADPPNRNTTRSTVGTFTVQPGPGPSIRLANGQSTTIRTGSAVKANITDPAGIGKASYSIRGVSYDLRAPDFAIDTSTFPEGTVTVNVTAENIHQVASSATFTFTVDNTAPSIVRVVMDPARPRAGDTVKVTITTQSEVQGVSVARKVDGNLVETLNATRKTGGTFEVTFDAEDGDHRLDVTARDTAGNAKLQDGAVVFSARPGSPLPMPMWVPLLALAAVAVLLHRRSTRP